MKPTAMSSVACLLLTSSLAFAQPIAIPDSVYPPLEPAPQDDADDVDAFGRPLGGLHLDLSATYMTDYVFRGVERFDADRREDAANYQYDVRLSFDLGKLPHPYVDLFVNVGENDPVSSFQEVRPEVGFEWPVKPFVVSAGHTNYIFPDREALDTAEVFVKVAFDDSTVFHTERPLLNPYVYAAYDYDLYDGLYLQAGVRPTYRFERTGFSLTLDAHVAYVSGFRGLLASTNESLSENGFQHYQVGVIGNYELNTLLNIPDRYGKWSIAGYLYYTDGIDNELNANNQLWGGAGITLRY